jgi:hypothetical protein
MSGPPFEASALMKILNIKALVETGSDGDNGQTGRKLVRISMARASPSAVAHCQEST